MKTIKRLIFSLAAVLLFSTISSLQAQDDEHQFGIKFSGFVKADYLLDSRQTISARRGHFLLFPAAADYDDNGNDINANPHFNMLAIQSRLSGKITGPDFFNMKTSGFIEGAFFGQSEGDINGFRLRHAYLKLSSDKLDILMGQYWHPMFVTSNFPGVYSFNTGAPFLPFSRNPQLRISTKGLLKFAATIYTQLDFASRGPSGTSCEYLRNSATPAMNAQLYYDNNNNITAGLGANYKTIKPSLTDVNGLKNEELISSMAFMAHFKAKFGKLTYKIQGTLGQDMADVLMVGGISEAETKSGYTNSTVYALWTEISSVSEHFEWGLFGGYIKNLGLSDALSGNVYGLVPNIDYQFRVSPRIAWKSGSTKIGLELEATSAVYGEISKGEKVFSSEGVDAVTNLRALLFALYSF